MKKTDLSWNLFHKCFLPHIVFFIFITIIFSLLGIFLKVLFWLWVGKRKLYCKILGLCLVSSAQVIPAWSRAFNSNLPDAAEGFGESYKKKEKTTTRGHKAIEKFVAEQHGHQMWGILSNSAIKDQAFSSSV